MSRSKLSIRQVMFLIALAAVSLAVVRAVPLEFLTSPTIWILVGALDFVIAWKLILQRPFTTLHYTALVVVIIAYLILANLAWSGSIRPLSVLLVRWYQQLFSEGTSSFSRAGSLRVGEIWAAAVLSLLLALSAGWAALWLDRRLGWDIAAFWRGALLGLFVACLLATIDDAVHGGIPLQKFSIRWVCRMAGLGVGVIAGGWAGCRWLRSSRVEPVFSRSTTQTEGGVTVASIPESSAVSES